MGNEVSVEKNLHIRKDKGRGIKTLNCKKSEAGVAEYESEYKVK